MSVFIGAILDVGRRLTEQDFLPMPTTTVCDIEILHSTKIC
ncbi:MULTISPECIES: hypothetical protein [Methylobacterium]|nr:hypothetical protein [Methylobacterium sp.]